jgi:hypothetical protein
MERSHPEMSYSDFCNIVSKCGKDSLMFQNSFLTRIPYSY